MRIAAIFKVIDPYILIMLGLVVLASVLPVRGEAAVWAGWITNAAIVLLFFLHGAKLSREAIIAGFGNWRVHALVLATTFLVFPLIGWAMTVVLAGVIAPMILSGLLFLTLLPSTVQSSIAFTAIARGNVAAAVCSASLSNLLGIFLTPLMVALLMGQTAQISAGAIEKIALQLLAPFVAGHLLRPLIGKVIDQHKALLGRVDRASILLLVYTAFSASVVAGLWSKVTPYDLLVAFALSCMVLALILWGAWWASGRAGLSYEDRVVVLFCGSKKSMASGIPIAGSIFPAAVLGPVILPVMVFHQIQLIVCALIAPRLVKSRQG